jgi:hypothetical protein
VDIILFYDINNYTLQMFCGSAPGLKIFLPDSRY